MKYGTIRKKLTDLSTCLILVFIYFLCELGVFAVIYFHRGVAKNAKLYGFTKNKHIKHYESIY